MSARSPEPVGTAGASTPRDHVRGARTMLFVPGSRPDRFDRAGASDADLAVLDLEDAVSPEERPTARRHVTRWLAAGGTAAVRINALTTEDALEDRDALRSMRPTAVMVAKAEDPAALASLAEELDRPVIALLESAAGLHRAAEIAAAPGVERLAIGHLDLAADLGCAPSRTAMAPLRIAVVLASRLAGLPGPLDGVTTALDDDRVLREDVEHALDLGLPGKLLLHPRQVAPVHAALRPTEAERDWARRVLEATADDPGAVRVDGEMVDAPVIARARALLRREDTP